MNPNVASPEPQAAVEPVVQTPAAAEPVLTPQQTDRQAAINNYSQLYQTPAPPVTPAPEQIPVTPEPVSPEPSVDISALQSTIAQLQAEIESLKPKPPTPDPSTAPKKAAMENWVELMAQGKYDEADDFLFKHYAPKLQAQIAPQLVQQAAEQSKAEQAITTFISEFERTNSDLLPMRDYVVAGAERRLQIAQNENKIKTTADFVREYQKAVTDEANELRTKLQVTRGAGKDEAMTARRQVLNATTLEPSSIQLPQGQKPAPQTASEYIDARANRLRQLQGLSI